MRVVVPPDILFALSAPRLAALLAARPLPRALAARLAKAARAAKHGWPEALFAADLPSPHADALLFLARLADEIGRAAVLEAGDACGCADRLLPWALEEPAADVAARLLEMQLRGKSRWVERVLARARIRLDRLLPSRPSYDRVARAPRPIAFDDHARVALAMREVYGAAFVDAWTVVESDHSVHVAVLYAAPMTRETAVSARGKLSDATLRPLCADVLHVDVAAGRLHVTTQSPARLAATCAAVGRALWGDPGFFSEGPSLTLKRLQLRGDEAFDRASLPRAVASGAAVAVQWDSGKDARVEVRAPDALRALAEHARIDGGYFTRATLRYALHGAAEAVDAFVQLPHRLSISDPRFEREVREALAGAGIFDPGALPDDAHTLAPFVHPEWRWREILGDGAFAAMADSGLLAKTRTRGVAAPDLRALGRSFVTFPVPGEPRVFYALSEDWSAPARDVSEAALRSWALDESALVSKMQRELGLRAAAARPMAGALDLGTLHLGDARFWVLFALRPPERGFADAIARGARAGTTPIVLLPEGRRGPEGVRAIELSLAEQLGAASVARVVGDLARAYELEAEVEPWRVASPDRRVVVDRNKREVRIDGVLMTRFGERAYKMIECLALRAGEIVPPKELGEYLVSTGSFLQAARQTRPDVLKRIAQSFADAGLPAPRDLESIIVVEGKRGYRLGVSSVVV